MTHRLPSVLCEYQIGIHDVYRCQTDVIYPPIHCVRFSSFIRSAIFRHSFRGGNILPHKRRFPTYRRGKAAGRTEASRGFS